MKHITYTEAAGLISNSHSSTVLLKKTLGLKEKKAEKDP